MGFLFSEEKRATAPLSQVSHLQCSISAARFVFSRSPVKKKIHSRSSSFIRRVRNSCLTRSLRTIRLLDQNTCTRIRIKYRRGAIQDN